MRKHLFKLFFGALFVAIATFAGCSDDDTSSAIPELTVSTETLNFTDETGSTQTVEITANCKWTISTTDLGWATVTPTDGEGSMTLSVTVSELPEGTLSRSGKISFMMIHPEFGKWGLADQTVTVNQYGEGVVPPPDTDPIYYNDFDKEVADKTYGTGTSYPYLDQFEGWINHSGTGAENVTYSYNGISVRSNSTSDSGYSNYAGSGSNNLFFGSNGLFTIENIAIDGKKNLKLSFGAERYSQSLGSVFVHEDFVVQLSNDGSNWSSALSYTFAQGTDPDAVWDLASADFTLPDGVSTLYVRFTSNVASVHRIDDVKLEAGNGGQQISFEGEADPTDPKIAKVDPAALAFAAAGGSKEVTVTLTNGSDCTLDASADNAQFSVSVDGNTVTVTAAENTEEQSIEGKLTIRLMKEGSEVDSTVVTLSQSGTGAGSDTSIFQSQEALTCTADSSTDACYTLGSSSTFNGEAATGVKLGTSSKSGVFTSAAVGVTGDKKLSFYAAAWKAKTATIYVTVNNGGSVNGANSAELAANDSVTGNPPFTITVTDSDYYTFELTGLTAESTISISTSENFTAETSSAPRAVVAGIQIY